MKAAQIEVGRDYTCKVSGRVVPVRVLEKVEREKSVGSANSLGGQRWRTTTSYRCRNLVTGREIVVRSCQRFRGPAVQEAKQHESAIGRMMETHEQP